MFKALLSYSYLSKNLSSMVMDHFISRTSFPVYSLVRGLLPIHIYPLYLLSICEYLINAPMYGDLHSIKRTSNQPGTQS